MEINFKKLLFSFLPVSLRQSTLFALFYAMIWPLEDLYNNSFKNDCDTDFIKLRHNGQVCYLRKILNDNFDDVKRQIKIEDGNRFKRQYIYTEAEVKYDEIIHLGEVYIREESDYADTGVDFIVQLPSSMFKGLEKEAKENLENQVKAIVDFYRLASKRYKLEII